MSTRIQRPALSPTSFVFTYAASLIPEPWYRVELMVAIQVPHPSISRAVDLIKAG